MKGSSLLFMVFSWMIVVVFVVFCFTVILMKGNPGGKATENDVDSEREEET